MKQQLHALLFILIAPFCFSQTSEESHDTVFSSHEMLYATSAEWNNWFYDNHIPVGMNVICYYDSEQKYKLFEGTKVGDSVNHMFNWKIYYLTGQIRESYSYDLNSTPESTPIIRSFFINGELRSEGFGGYIHSPKSGRKWEYNHLGVKSLIEELAPGWKINYEIATGDTAVYSLTESKDSMVYLSYSQNKREYKKVYYKGKLLFSERYSDPAELARKLNITLDTNVLIGYNGNEPVYKTQKIDLTAEIRKLDSLHFYKNLISLHISCNNKEDVEAIIKKMKVIKSLKNLKQLTLSGLGFTEIPKVVYGCKNLKSLALENTEIKSIPKSILKLEQLRYLSIFLYLGKNYYNNFTYLNELPNLRALHMTWNYDDSLPSVLGNLESIKTLVLDNGSPANFWDFNPETMNYDTVIQNHNFEILGKMQGLVTLNMWAGNAFSYYIEEHQLENPALFVDYFSTCFPANTQILMANGSAVSIDSIHQGDQIISYNEITNKMDTSVVNKVHVHQTNSPQLIQIKCVSNGFETTISATVEHPFYSKGNWIKAQNLKVGDELLVYHGGIFEKAVISDLETITSNINVVYNLNTSSHTFTANGILVHNK